MTPEKAAAVAEFLIPMASNEYQTTRKVLAAVPDGQADYRPAEKNMTARDLAEHIASVDMWFLEGMAKGEFSAEGGPTGRKPSEIAADYEAKMPALLEQLQSLTPEQWARPAQFYAWTNPMVTYLQFFIVHAAHHRGQLSAYLRPMGAKVPAIYGGSADEPMTAAQEA